MKHSNVGETYLRATPDKKFVVFWMLWKQFYYDNNIINPLVPSVLNIGRSTKILILI